MTDLSTRPYISPRPGYEGPRRSLILAGGGMRVAYQAGVIRALSEAGLCFAHGDGTSGGTMNLAMLLSGLSPEEMCDRWRTLQIKDFVSLMPLDQYLKAGDIAAMGDADGITGKVFPHLGIDVAKINAHQEMVGTFNVCNFTHKTNEVIPNDRIDLDLLVAGVSLPVFMPPVRKNGFLYTDSVWIKDANLMEAVRRGAEELWVLWCIGNTAEYYGGVFRQYVHMIEMSANGALFEEFERIKELGRPVRLHVIKPEYPLPLDPDLYLGKIDTATLIDRGYADGKAYLKNMPAEGVPLEPEATRMRTSPPGIAFRETLSGALALGETDPEQGHPRGEPIALHAAIQIRDLDRFLTDALHTAEAAAHLDYAPFGNALPASTGHFNVFSPAGQPGVKRVLYEFGFEHQGRPLHLAGEKEIHDGAGLNLWKQASTVYARLHEGEDTSGPVIGAGMLQWKMSEAPKLVASIHATDTPNVTESGKLVARFGRYFLGELWDSFA